MLREPGRTCVIGFFNHIPFPADEIFAQLPVAPAGHRRPARRGPDRLSAQADASNFVQRRPAASATRPGQQASRCRTATAKHPARAGPGVPDLHRCGGVSARLAQCRTSRPGRSRSAQDLGNPKTILLGVDRLDYTKGIRHRLKAYEELLHDGKVTVEDATLIQVASPSRERVDSYRAAARRDRRHGGPHQRRPRHHGDTAVRYLHHSYPRRRDGGAVPGRRRHAGHRPARRHEPRRQGIRRQPGQTTTGRWC